MRAQPFELGNEEGNIEAHVQFARLESCRELCLDQNYRELTLQMQVLRQGSLSPLHAFLLELLQLYPGVMQEALPNTVLLQRATAQLEAAIALQSSLAQAWVWELMQFLQVAVNLYHPALHSTAMAAELYARCGRDKDVASMHASRCRVMMLCEMYPEVVRLSDALLAQRELLSPARLCGVLNNAATVRYHLALEAGVSLGASPWEAALSLHKECLQVAQAGGLTKMLFFSNANIAILSALLGRPESVRCHMQALAQIPFADSHTPWPYWARLCEALLLCQGAEATQGWLALQRLSRDLAEIDTELHADHLPVQEVVLRMLAVIGRETGRFEEALTASEVHMSLQQRQRRMLSRQLGESVDGVLALPRLQSQNQQLTAHGELLENSLQQRNSELRSALDSLQAEAKVRLAAEVALQQAHDDLEHQVRVRTAELEQAMSLVMRQEKQLALGRMVVGIAHEMNTPLGNARMAASTINEQCLQLIAGLQAGSLRRPELQAALECVTQCGGIADRSLVRASDLVQRFKALAIGQHTETSVKFDVVALIQQLVESWQIRLALENVQLEVQMPAQLCVIAYPNALLQVLDQLLENSVVHGFLHAERGCVNLCVQIEAGQLSILLSDNGCGISDANLPHVFEPFFTTQLGQSGTGLGLSIVNSLVCDLMGGRVQIESKPALGTIIRLSFPVQRLANLS
ncbi:HAMP domain-containing histidine kinase [Undibacterium piscinae]|uniref:histidine kinase n=1 Tax=Undibacterium piscinae TaxID=2495591 RepID=A0A6M4A7R2_9BURK|nr:HAMP domain-containing histidine kinase [Undibacterium piscinae]